MKFYIAYVATNNPEGLEDRILRGEVQIPLEQCTPSSAEHFKRTETTLGGPRVVRCTLTAIEGLISHVHTQETPQTPEIGVNGWGDSYPFKDIGVEDKTVHEWFNGK